MNKCAFCGQQQDFDINHFQGAIGKVCQYGSCSSRWQNFKIRLNKFKESKYPDVVELAYLVEKRVHEEHEPAMEWNQQMMYARRLATKDALTPVILERIRNGM